MIGEENKTEKKTLEQNHDLQTEAILWLDKDSRIFYANASACKITGYSLKELLNSEIKDIIVLISDNHYKKIWGRLKVKHTYVFSTDVLKRNKERIRVGINSVYKKIGKEGYLIFFIYDKAGSMQSAYEHAAACENYKFIVENSLDVMLNMDSNLKITYCNNAVIKLLGYEENEVVEHSFIDFVIPENRSEVKESLEYALKGEEISMLEIPMRRKDNQECYAEVNISPVEIKNNISGLFAVLRDITLRMQTQSKIDEAILEYERIYVESQLLNQSLEKEISERMKIEEELLEAKVQAESANKAKSQFLANMSHEIRTPLNAVLGFSEILKEKLHDNITLLDYIDGINTGGRSLLSLINDILDLSKIEAGKIDIQKEPVSLRNLIQEVKQIFQTKIKSKGLDLIIDLDNELPETVELDYLRMRQILFNLVGNAVKFTSSGEIYISVKILKKYKQKKSYDLEFNVTDTGIGIPRKQQKLIFDPFKQVERQSARRYEGTGLGLSITKRLVEMLNGEISVESRISKGSKFIIVLRNVSAKISKDVKDSTLEFEVHNIKFQNSKVLIVDDSKSGRIVFKGYLADYDLEIIEAENGLEAVKKAEKYIPDIIFMDIRMPEMDGFSAATAIKSNISTRFIPIVALTASIIKNDSRNEVSNFNGLLLKPVSKKEIIRNLCKFLPHTIKKELSESKQKPQYIKDYLKKFKEQEISKEDIQNIHKKFKGKIEVRYKELMDFIDINDIKEMANEIKQLGETYNVESFNMLGKDLWDAANLMHIHEIKEIINVLPKYIPVIKSKQE